MNTTAITRIDEELLNSRPSYLRRQIAIEVQMLATQYVPGEEADALEAAADAIDACQHQFGCATAHMRLWAAEFRRRASAARNTGLAVARSTFSEDMESSTAAILQPTITEGVPT